MDLLEVGWGQGLDLAGSGQGQLAALVNAIMYLRVPQNAGNFWTSCEQVSFSRRTLLRGVYGINIW